MELQTIIERQREINNKLYNTKKLTLGERQEWTQALVISIIDSLSRILAQINWKIWEKKVEVNALKIRLELIELFSLVLSLMDIWGMGEEEIYQLYLAKKGKNEK